MALLINTTHGLVGQLTILMELTVTATALAETHLLHIGHHTLHLIVARLQHFVQPLLRLIILHADDRDEGMVVAGLRPTLTIAARQLVSPRTIVQGGIDVTIMRCIGTIVQLVDSFPVRARTG